ncbi:MAG TPA: metallophosphoesterase [Steroidobacteraceae bacterium]|jgi:predicted phosphodiesterase
MRLFAISDVHTDFRENFQLLERLSTREYRGDTLILAGDVSHDISVLRRTLDLFLSRFAHVFFVPGNHELWIRSGVQEDSLQKFNEILRICEAYGVSTTAKSVGNGSGRVWVVPLFSWYTRPEEGPDTLFRPRPLQEPSQSVWSDDYLIKWPSYSPGHCTPQSLEFSAIRYFLSLNETRVGVAYDASIVSFSHFMPRADLMFPGPDQELPHVRTDRHIQCFNFSRVAGSTLIEDQIRRLGPRVHVYGHQHRNRRRYHNGIWYVSNCLGYREERENGSVGNPEEVVRQVWPMETAVSSQSEDRAFHFAHD